MHFHDVGLTTYRKTHEMRSECPKTAFLGTIRRVIDVCATVLYGICRLFTNAFTLSRFHVRYARNVHAHEADSDCGAHLLASPAALAACGAKVRHENHSDKLLCEKFTMKRIFMPKATLIARRIIRK